MSTPARPTCETCRAFVWSGGTKFEIAPGVHVAPGYCRRHAPTLVGRGMTRWPSVQTDDWCLDHTTDDTRESAGGEP